RLQLGLEQGTHELAVAFAETRQAPPEARLEIGHHAAGPGVALVDLLGGHFNAVFGEARDVRLHRQQLAVDEDPVAVEDDEIERLCHGATGGTPAVFSARRWRWASVRSSKSSINS